VLHTSHKSCNLGVNISLKTQTFLLRFFFPHSYRASWCYLSFICSPVHSLTQCTSEQCNIHTYTHQQLSTNTCSHTTTVLTTHRCVVMDHFNNCNFSKHEWCAPWWWCYCTETCRSCFNVNFNIVFKTTHLCFSWWLKNNYI
jgi:hypothetical protein